MAGVTRAAVSYYRNSRGIMSLKAKEMLASPKKDRPEKRSKIEPFRHLLGVLTDADVAARAGVSRGAVSMYRLHNGIAATGPRGRPPKAVPPTTLPDATRRYAWRLRLRTEEQGEIVRITTAYSMLDASLQGKMVGEVLEIERLDEMLEIPPP